MKAFVDQEILTAEQTVVIDEYLKFQEIKRDFEIKHTYRNGYWNCYIPTQELIDHLNKHNIKYHLKNSILR